MPKPPATWKNIERAVCAYLGWERTHWALPDGRGQGYALEVKHGKQIPKWLLKMWGQAKTNAEGLDLIPVGVCHPPRYAIDECIVCMSLKHFKELINDSRELG